MDFNKILSINDKKKIISDVAQLSENQQIEIFNILNLKKEVKYTENKNGIFINLDDVDNNSLNEIIKFISFCKESNKVLDKNANQMLIPPEPSNIDDNMENNVIINDSISKIIQKENYDNFDEDINYKISKISNDIDSLNNSDIDDNLSENENLSDSD
jgi:hypothetical protein